MSVFILCKEGRSRVNLFFCWNISDSVVFLGNVMRAHVRHDASTRVACAHDVTLRKGGRERKTFASRSLLLSPLGLFCPRL